MIWGAKAAGGGGCLSCKGGRGMGGGDGEGAAAADGRRHLILRLGIDSE